MAGILPTYFTYLAIQVIMAFLFRHLTWLWAVVRLIYAWLLAISLGRDQSAILLARSKPFLMPSRSSDWKRLETRKIQAVRYPTVFVQHSTYIHTCQVLWKTIAALYVAARRLCIVKWLLDARWSNCMASRGLHLVSIIFQRTCT